MSRSDSVNVAFVVSTTLVLTGVFGFLSSLSLKAGDSPFSDSTASNLYFTGFLAQFVTGLAAVWIFSSDSHAENKMMLYGVIVLDLLAAVLILAGASKLTALIPQSGFAAGSLFSGFAAMSVPLIHGVVAFLTSKD